MCVHAPDCGRTYVEYRVQSHTDAACDPEYRVFPHTATGSVGCSRPLLYCEDECVRVCTLYVG